MAEWDDDSYSTVPTPKKTIFQEMKESLNQKFSNLTALVNQRKLALDLKIDQLEIEFNNKKKQIEKDKQTMVELREMTEQKLVQNTLLDVQDDIIRDINNKIERLDAESMLGPRLTPNWNYGELKQLIDQMDVKLTPKDSAEVTDHVAGAYPPDPNRFSISPRNFTAAPVFRPTRYQNTTAQKFTGQISSPKFP